MVGDSLLKKTLVLVSRTFFQIHKENVLVTCYSTRHNAALDVFPSLKTEDKAKGKHDYSPVKQSMEYSILGDREII